MKLLVDTQSWLWMQTTPERLNDDALALISDPTTDMFRTGCGPAE